MISMNNWLSTNTNKCRVWSKMSTVMTSPKYQNLMFVPSLLDCLSSHTLGHTPRYTLHLLCWKICFRSLTNNKKSTPTNQGRGDGIKGKTGSVSRGVRGKRGELERTLMVLIYIPGFLDVLLGSATLNKINQKHCHWVTYNKH